MHLLLSLLSTPLAHGHPLSKTQSPGMRTQATHSSQHEVRLPNTGSAAWDLLLRSAHGGGSEEAHLLAVVQRRLCLQLLAVN